MKSALWATLVGIVLATAVRDPHRKTLRFGPSLSYTGLVSNSATLSNKQPKLSDPLDVAKQFIREHVGDNISFDISSSHTDANTGVTHVYAQQKMDGLMVGNAHFNLNIKDGVVLSYGDSFYREDPKSQPQSPVDPQAELCEGLKQKIEKKNVSDDDLIQLKYKWNCEQTESKALRLLQQESSNESDPRAALLHFMISASVSDSPKLMSDPLSSLSDIRLISSDGEFVAENVQEALKPVKVKMAYLRVPGNGTTHLEKVWKFVVKMKDNYYEAAVSVQSPHRILSVLDRISDSPIYKREINMPRARGKYRVFKFGSAVDPEDGNRTLESELGDKWASPAGWHSFPLKNDTNFLALTNTTWGNNVIAQENWDGDMDDGFWIDNYRPKVNGSLIFDFPYMPKHPKLSGNETEDDCILRKEPRKYIDASLTQMFYIVNMVHDLYYRYGFDESAGNFQQHNFGRGGKGGDFIIANAQDGTSYNNANFMTPPDGAELPRMRMYIWNNSDPYRDGDMQADIVIHELTHGLSIRLTGGADNVECLLGEGAAMGEGWGDFMSAMIYSEKEYADVSAASWTSNKPNGIRTYPYSIDKEVNPLTYQSMDQEHQLFVHKIGTLWAEVLFVVAQRLIKKHGFGKSIYPPLPDDKGKIPDGDFFRPQKFDSNGKPKPRIPKYGNTLIIQLVINAMKHQPCRPSFFDGRNAIIEADKVLTEGENFCELWRGFADRGLGTNAEFGGYFMGFGMRTNGFKIPKECAE